MIFKQDRINRGYTNTKLAKALLRMYDKKKGMNLPCLQQRISRFESNDMSFKAMRKFQPMLAKWLTDLCWFLSQMFEILLTLLFSPLNNKKPFFYVSKNLTPYVCYWTVWPSFTACKRMFGPKRLAVNASFGGGSPMRSGAGVASSVRSARKAARRNRDGADFR